MTIDAPHLPLVSEALPTVEREYCQNCRWVMWGLFLPACSNRHSEFYGGPVHPHGGCCKWSIDKDRDQS